MRSGGVVGDEDQVAIAPDGTVHLLGDQGAWRVVSPAGEMIYCSPRASGYLRRCGDFDDDDDDDES